MTDTITTFSFALKEMYSDQYVQNLMYEGRPTLAIMPKAGDFKGKSFPQPVVMYDGQGYSHTFATAQANQTNITGAEFQMTPIRDYAVALIDGLLIDSSNSDPAAFLDATEAQIKLKIRGLANRMSMKLFRDTGGSIGQLSATSGVTTVITLANASDIVNFNVGQTLRLSAAADGTALHTTGTVVTNLDKNLGTITVTPSMATMTPVGAVNDYIYIDGDATLSMAGLASWIPTAAPAATAFYSVDRTVAMQELSGVRYDGRPYSIREAMITMGQLMYVAGGSPDYVVMNPVNYGHLLQSLETQKRFVDVTTDAGVSFKAWEFEYDNGTVKVISDRWCPINLAYWLQTDTWKLRSAGALAHVREDRDGLIMLRAPTADAFEIRWRFYGNLMCNAPGWNGVMQIN